MTQENFPFLKITNALDADPVAHPSHYNAGKIEVIEAIEDWKLGFHRGNAVKYVARAGKKDPAKEVEDLEKAVWYIQREIECVRAKIDGRPAVKPDDMRPGPVGFEFAGPEITLRQFDEHPEPLPGCSLYVVRVYRKDGGEHTAWWDKNLLQWRASEHNGSIQSYQLDLKQYFGWSA